MTRSVLAVLLLGSAAADAGTRAPVVSRLGAEYRCGQVFLTWRETPVPEGTTFNVYLSRSPVADEATLAEAKRVCRRIEPRSAEDWTRDAGNYGKGRVKDPKTGKTPPAPAPVGYIIQDGGERLDPASGLHVHTVAEDEEGACYYAVTAEAGIRGIWTFWYGTSNKIAQLEDMEQGTPTNYTERRLLFEIDWVKRYLKTDPNRTYCSGSSMGGCGAMSFAFRHPEIFAAVSAHVPIVAYNDGDEKKGQKLGWHGNSHRLIAFCGPLSLACSDGMPLSKRLDSTVFVLSHPGDLPFLMIAVGRQDASIPWHNNPDLFRALQRMRHGCLVAWNNGDHPGVSERLPADFNEWTTAKLTRFALDKSYPAFSNCSRDGDPGDGDNNDGDIVGSINRGLDWTEPRETADRYEVLITYDLAPADLPLSVDVTPRRCPIFKLDPGQACSAVNIDSRGRTIQATRLKADRLGLATFRQFQVTGKEGNRLVLKK